MIQFKFGFPLSPTMHLVGFEPRTFRFYHNDLARPLGHSPHTNTALNGYMDKLQIITVKMVSTSRL